MANAGRRTNIADIKRMVKEKRPISEITEKAENLQQLKFAKLYLEVTQTRRAIQDIDMRWYHGPTGSGKTFAVKAEFPDVYTPVSCKWWRITRARSTY